MSIQPHPPGTAMGGYVLGRVLGSGGMGTVYQATDADGRQVAFKLLHPGIAADPASRARLLREVTVLRQVTTPAVARLLDAELDQAEAFIVTELIEGESLEVVVRARGPLARPGLADLADGLEIILSDLHAHGVIHRDLKPGNIMLTSAGPVLIDFGIAQRGQDPRLTGTGLVMGTPGFVAPELIRGGQPSPATDRWGAAAVLAFAATGRQPFGTGQFEAVITRVLAGDADVAGLPDDVARALLAALAGDESRRISLGNLAAACRGLPVIYPPPMPPGGTGQPPMLPGVVGMSPTVVGPAPMAPYGGAGPGYGTGQPPMSPYGTGQPMAPGVGGPGAAPYGGGVPGYGAGQVMAGQPMAGLPMSPVGDGVGGPGGAGAAGLASFPPAYRPDAALLGAVSLPPPPVLPPVIPKMGWLVLVLGVTATATASLTPFGPLVVGLALIVIGRAVGCGADWLYRRRLARGEARQGLALAILATPWHLLKAIVGTLPSAALAGLILVGTWLVLPRIYSPDRPSTWAGDDLIWTVVVAVGLLLCWFGPLTKTARRGTNLMLGHVLPRWGVALAVAIAALIWTGLIVAGWLMSEGGAWVSPLPW